MNADGSAGLSAAVTIGANAPFLLPLAVILFGLVFVLTAGAIVLIVVGASGPRSHRRARQQHDLGPVGANVATVDHPVVLTARLDPGLSRRHGW